MSWYALPSVSSWASRNQGVPAGRRCLPELGLLQIVGEKDRDRGQEQLLAVRPRDLLDLRNIAVGKGVVEVLLIRIVLGVRQGRDQDLVELRNDVAIAEPFEVLLHAVLEVGLLIWMPPVFSMDVLASETTRLVWERLASGCCCRS